MFTSPPLLGLLSLLALAQQRSTPADWKWLFLFFVLNLLIPVVYILYLLRRGELSDFHMRNRSERIKPMRTVPLLFLFSWLVFQFNGAPMFYQALALVGGLHASAMLLITLRWKISGHSTGVAAFCTLLWGLYGMPAAPVFLLLPAVVWARVALGRHTLAQTVAGALLGGLAALALFLLGAGECLGSGQLFCG